MGNTGSVNLKTFAIRTIRYGDILELVYAFTIEMRELKVKMFYVILSSTPDDILC